MKRTICFLCFVILFVAGCGSMFSPDSQADINKTFFDRVIIYSVDSEANGTAVPNPFIFMVLCFS
ncbi:hypothetical protein ACFL6U_29265, partial [Planctomycetota bacterium]